jgi:hypothetical protein
MNLTISPITHRAKLLIDIMQLKRTAQWLEGVVHGLFKKFYKATTLGTRGNSKGGRNNHYYYHHSSKPREHTYINLARDSKTTSYNTRDRQLHKQLKRHK